MTTLSIASRQWASRPNDERFVSLYDLHDHFTSLRKRSRGAVVSSRDLILRPDEADELRGLKVYGANGVGYAPTHSAFQQLCSLVQAPAGYLRELPAPLAADNLNYGFKFKRTAEDVGVLLRKGTELEAPTFAAATGPRYGRIWNVDIADALVSRFGDGLTGDWRVPGEFGVALDRVTKANTTLYASDRDMFVFLADETNRIIVPNRRDGRAGSMARGFYIQNSETGDCSFKLGLFLFDYACANRTIWGVNGFKEITLRHTASAPHRWLEEAQPVLEAYHNASAAPIERALEAAQSKKVDDLSEFLKSRRFAYGMTAKLEAVHALEENRPIETLWDVSVAMTAHAKAIPYQDERVALEREAGRILELAA